MKTETNTVLWEFSTNGCKVCFDIYSEANGLCDECSDACEFYMRDAAKDIAVFTIEKNKSTQKYPRPLYASELLSQINKRLIQGYYNPYSRIELMHMYWFASSNDQRTWVNLWHLHRDWAESKAMIDFWMTK